MHQPMGFDPTTGCVLVPVEVVEPQLFAALDSGAYGRQDVGCDRVAGVGHGLGDRADRLQPVA